MKQIKTLKKLIFSDFYKYFGRFPNFFDIFYYSVLGRHPYFQINLFLSLNSRLNKFFLKYIYNRIQLRRGLSIPPSIEIGYGLHIAHGFSIVINPTTKIGDNVNISHFLTIGSNHGQAALIKNQVYIGPNVKILENVIVENNTTICAGSVVTKSISENSTVCGVPAKSISMKKPGRFIKNQYEKT